MAVRADLKIVMLGDNHVGKSCLMERFVNDRFNGFAGSIATIGTAYASKHVEADEKQIILGIWDTAGSERFNAMTKIYYRGAHAAIVCYDTSVPKSFNKVKYWVNELRNTEENCKIYICATKLDLLDGNREMLDGIDRVRNYADGVSYKFYETSSKTGENIVKLFQDVATDLSPLVRTRRNSQKSGIEFIGLSMDNKISTCCYSGANI